MAHSAALDPSPAVVLRSSPYGESDAIVVLATREHGKLRCMARGLRRSRKRFPGGLSIGSCGVAEFARSRGDLVHLDGFRRTADGSGLGRSLEGYAYACYVCELSEALLVEGQPEARVFELLERAISQFTLGHATAEELRRFEIGILDSIGCLPDLARCAQCGLELNTSVAHLATAAAEAEAEGEGPTSAFDATRGRLCDPHAGGSPRWPISVFALGRELREMVEIGSEVATWTFSELSVQARRGLRDVLWRCLREQLPRPLASRAFLATLQRK